MKTPISTINFHLLEPCNMRCGFCFATFQDVKHSILPKGHLPKDEALRLVRLLGESKLFQKITFVGGEPTLCSWLLDLVKEAKKHGLKTCVVTNGTKISENPEKWLSDFRPFLDQIALSIDSLHADTNLRIGRAVVGKTIIPKKDYLRIIKTIHAYGFSLKINTVVNQFNFEEDFTDFIRTAKPKRWKIFQVLPIKGQNDTKINDFIISDKQFADFIQKHQNIADILDFVPETNNDIKGSYLMIDPAGRFFDNLNGTHEYGKPILEVGVQTALADNQASYEKFLLRCGEYEISPENLTSNYEVDSSANLLTL